jgi:hypothetical protein
LRPRRGHDGRITGYATSLAYFGHAIGETTEDVKH